MYVCFASGLLKEGLSLLHWSSMIILLFYSFHSAFIHPFRCFYIENYTVYYSLMDIFRYIFSGKYYQDSLKGMICTKTNLTHILQDEDTRVEVATKPFLVIIFGHSIYFGLVVYFYNSAVRKRSLMQPGQVYTKFSKLCFQEVSSN